MSAREHPPSARIRILCRPRHHHLATFGYPLHEALARVWLDPTPKVRLTEPTQGAGSVVFVECLRCPRHDAPVGLDTMRVRLLAMTAAYVDGDPPPVRDIFV